MEEEKGHTCTLEFSLRLLPHPHLLLNWVTLDKPAQRKKNEEDDAEGNIKAEGEAKKEPNSDRQVMKGFLESRGILDD